MDIFHDDELQQLSVPKGATAEWVLKQDALFFLKDIVGVLNISPHRVQRDAKRLLMEEKDPYSLIGVRKVWSHWQVRMSVFRDYYLNDLRSEIQSVPVEIDGNELLCLSGIFRLSEVCRKIPFTAQQISHQAKKRKNSREEMGVWKDKRFFLVDMETFADWLTSVWHGR